MIKSIAKELTQVMIPEFKGHIKMIPFLLSDLSTVPEIFRDLVDKMISTLPLKEGTAYLTVDGKLIPANSTHRRPGAHIDGNYLPHLCSWGSSGGNGWKVGEGGRKLGTEDHKLSYETETGGMLIASTHVGCKGWVGEFDGIPGIGGDCSHISLPDNGFLLKPNLVYYGNSQFVHESLTQETDVERVLVRITLPQDYPVVFN